MTVDDLASRLDALLPQTQCRRCGEDGCRPYAEAIAAGRAEINRCPPGGLTTLAALAAATGRPLLPPDPAVWPDAAVDADRALIPTVAVIDPERCIGCYKCVLVCPVDAIAGAPKYLHAVIADDCSGCDLCLPPCPVDCITMQPRAAALTPVETMRDRWRALHARRAARLARERISRDEARRQRRGELLAAQVQAFDLSAAIARAQARRTPPT